MSCVLNIFVHSVIYFYVHVSQNYMPVFDKPHRAAVVHDFTYSFRRKHDQSCSMFFWIIKLELFFAPLYNSIRMRLIHFRYIPVVIHTASSCTTRPVFHNPVFRTYTYFTQRHPPRLNTFAYLNYTHTLRIRFTFPFFVPPTIFCAYHRAPTSGAHMPTSLHSYNATPYCKLPPITSSVLFIGRQKVVTFSIPPHLGPHPATPLHISLSDRLELPCLRE